jgi:hypothetical protein
MTLTPSQARRENRNFGLIIAGGLGALTVVRFIWSGAVAWWLVGIGVGFLVAGLMVPDWLNPVRKIWMKLAAVLGFVNSRILLTVVFVGVVTPIALVLRLLGRRPLVLTRDGAASYWQARRPEEFTAERMERQF